MNINSTKKIGSAVEIANKPKSVIECWLQKNKDLSSNNLTSILFKLVTGYVDNIDRAKMTRTTIKDLVTRQLPIDTKDFY